MSFKEKLEDRTREADAIVKKFLPGGERQAENGLSGEASTLAGAPLSESLRGAETVVEAMRYSVEAGGKRLRPILLMETYRLFGGEHPEIAEPFAAAIEMIHTYSLIHDDLPAMDNDDYRRGRKTTHKVYGEAMGILAGDGLLNYAFETAASAWNLTAAAAQTLAVARAMQLLAVRPGISGMIGGQVMDLEMEDGIQDVTPDSLFQMFGKKTGALISCAMEMGCVLAGGSVSDQKKVAEIARLTGLAFQIQDDILDVTGDEAKLGKPLHSDEKNEKKTSVTLLGLEGAKAKSAELSEAAVRLMREVQQEQNQKLRQTAERQSAESSEYDGFLAELIEYLVHRDY